MKSAKTDARSRYTQMLVKRSLLKLISEKPLKDITVAELCREAKVARGTFYNHFYDVYDIYESIENEFFELLVQKLEGIKTYSLNYDFFIEIMNCLVGNSDITSMIVLNPDESTLLKRILSYVRDKYIAEFSEKFPMLDRYVIESIFNYSSSGSISVIVDWFKQNKPFSPENMAKMIDAFNNIIINGCKSMEKELL